MKEFGIMLNRIYIVDDFYPNPDGVMENVFNDEREDNSGGNYAGVMNSTNFFTPEHQRVFQQLVGHPVSAGTSLTGKFRFSCVNDTYKQNIHFDAGGENLAWAGVVYMQKHYEEGIEGTSFYKHKETGLEEIPRSIEGCSKYGWNSIADLKKFLDTDGVDDSKWIKTLTVPYKYNRLVLFRPWLFHAPGKAFGSSIETSRIVQTIFLNQE
jgi:hypothetical protein